MELKRLLRLLSLSALIIYSASAFSINDVLDQIQPYLPYPLQPPSNPSQAQSPIPYSSNPGAIADNKAATFPCCICSGCTCSHTSCPRIIPRPGQPPFANWPIADDTPKLVAAAGCGEKYGLDACLMFVQQYLQALQPALEVASNHSHGYEEEKEKKEKKKEPCCGDGCSDAQCLGYLAAAVKNLQAPIDGTLRSVDDDKVAAAREVKNEL